ncbi:MAG: hypothetical protein L6Q59_13880, partial [Ignavibacteriaceae bacterium]|nr:hypothetical protein [Ignavibacteriaceae bacterium]
MPSVLTDGSNAWYLPGFNRIVAGYSLDWETQTLRLYKNLSPVTALHIAIVSSINVPITTNR